MIVRGCWPDLRIVRDCWFILMIVRDCWFILMIVRDCWLILMIVRDCWLLMIVIVDSSLYVVVNSTSWLSVIVDSSWLWLLTHPLMIGIVRTHRLKPRRQAGHFWCPPTPHLLSGIYGLSFDSTFLSAVWLTSRWELVGDKKKMFWLLHLDTGIIYECRVMFFNKFYDDFLLKTSLRCFFSCHSANQTREGW